MSAKPTNQPPAAAQPQNKPATAAPNASQTKPGQAPPVPAQQKPTPPAPKPAVAAVVLPDSTPAKTLLRTKFPNLFQNDGEFATLNADSVTAQGMRIKMERGTGYLTTHFLPILKFGGLLKPGLLWSRSAFIAKKIEVYNILNQKPFMALQQQGEKSWEAKSPENNNSLICTIKVVQKDLKRHIEVSVNNAKVIECSFVCPIQKVGCCAAPRPANLNGIQFALAAPNPNFDCEENPNGDACKDSLEFNIYYRPNRSQNEFNLMVALFQVVAFELK